MSDPADCFGELTVGAFLHSEGMHEATPFEWAQKIADLTKLSMEAALGEGGFLPAPSLHLVCDELRPTAYAGFVQSRPFWQGGDAYQAIVDLAIVASMANASRLVLAWEQADLHLALQMAGPSLPTGLVILDAPRAGEHVVSLHPAELVHTGTRPNGLPTITAKWGQVRRIVGERLPAPVAELLELWRTPRTWSDTDLMNTYLDLEDEGYRMRWTQPPDELPPEAWPQWRCVIEAILVAQDQTSA